MSRAPDKLRVFLANLLWFLSCIPGLVAFLVASRNVRRTQTAILGRILERNADTETGKRHHFGSIGVPDGYAAIPASEYEDYAASIEKIRIGETGILTRDPVEVLQPTSGSATATKLIPYTRSLREDFRAAIDPWIASLYLTCPSVLFGRHYWSISPSTALAQGSESTVSVGFADDADYLGGIQRFLSRSLFAVPPEVASVTDNDAFEYLTLLFLLRERNIRVMSIWHPSFLTVLIKALERRLPAIIRDIESSTIDCSINLDIGLRQVLSSRLSANQVRARELQGIDTSLTDFPGRVWSHLRVISCWTDGRSEPWLTTLARHFPHAAIQGKGLTATEGIVSFPMGRKGRKVCAIRSHFFEFVEIATGLIKHAWELETGKEYAVLLTTGGGLYRYRLHDIVRVTGFFSQVPCLEFVARDNLVSDLVGEKLNGQHVDQCLRLVEKQLGLRFSFAMLAPDKADDTSGYTLYMQPPKAIDVDYSNLADNLERLLNENYHYHHARQLRQLDPLKVFRVSADATIAYRNALLAKGMRAGEIKFVSLSSDTGWSTAFRGDMVTQAHSVSTA